MIPGPKGRQMDTKMQKYLIKPVENDDFWSKRGHDEY